ncbi:hypothetical protein J6590_044158 [Homalodisca vitripennis]|nr:hypothetical protein J6590_044158 [Homalodisca vitripennis]
MNKSNDNSPFFLLLHALFFNVLKFRRGSPDPPLRYATGVLILQKKAVSWNHFKAADKPPSLWEREKKLGLVEEEGQGFIQLWGTWEAYHEALALYNRKVRMAKRL